MHGQNKHVAIMIRTIHCMNVNTFYGVTGFIRGQSEHVSVKMVRLLRKVFSIIIVITDLEIEVLLYPPRTPRLAVAYAISGKSSM